MHRVPQVVSGKSAPRIVPWAGAAAMACAVGCGSPGPSDTGDSSQTSTSGAGQVSLCDSDPRVQTYALGLESKAQDGTVAVRFVDAQPAPPSKGNNTWTVEVVDAHGNPVN